MGGSKGLGFMSIGIEKFWSAVSPQLFISDGNAYGIVSVANASGFKVKQLVYIVAVGQPNIAVQIKRFISPTQFYVGPTGTARPLTSRSDLSLYTVAAGAYIYAEEQPKVILTPNDIIQSVYDQEPACAIRVDLVDQFGNYYAASNPLPVVMEGSITIAKVQIEGSDGSSLLNVNTDGSINVNVVETPVSGQAEKSIYNEITSVASGIQTQITFYTVPLTKSAILHRVSVSGDNFARYDVFLNGSPFDTKRTWFSDFNANFEYITGNNAGYVLNAGDTLAVKVLHTRPFVGTFEARIQVLEIS